MHKRIILLAIVLIVATAFWFVAKSWINNPGLDWGRMSDWLWPMLLLALLVTVKAIAYLLLEGRWRWGALAITAVPFIVLFGVNKIYLLAAVVMVLLNLFAIRRIENEARSRVTVHARSIVRGGLPLILMSIFLATSFAYYQSPSVQASVKTKALPPFIAETVRGTARQMLGQEFEQLPPKQRTATENQIVAETMGRINNFLAPYRQYIPPILAFGMFLILQGLSFAFVWLASAMSFGLFWILVKTQFVTIQRKSIEVESVTL